MPIPSPESPKPVRHVGEGSERLVASSTSLIIALTMECDGNYPCSSCVRNNIECIYVLERKRYAS